MPSLPKDGRWTRVRFTAMLGSDWRPELEIAGAQSSVFGYAGKHLGPEFFALVKREHEVRPAIARQGPMRPRLAFDTPPKLDKGGKDSAGLSRRPMAHAAATEIFME